MRKEKLLERGSLILERINKADKESRYHWMRLAKLAYENCESGYKKGNPKLKPYTYAQFSRDLGISRHQLCNNIKDYRDFYIKEGRQVSRIKRGDLAVYKRARRVASTKGTKLSVQIKKEAKKTPNLVYIESMTATIVRLKAFVKITKFNKKEKTALENLKKEARSLGRLV